MEFNIFKINKLGFMGGKHSLINLKSGASRPTVEVLR